MAGVASTMVTAGVTLWAIGLVLAPMLASLWPVVAGLLYAVGSLVCHQQPERSFHLAGAQLPVCARCLGLYAGAAAGALAWWWRRRSGPIPDWRPDLRVIGAAALPTALTVATALMGWGDPPNLWRAWLAVPLGVAGGVVVGAAASRDLK